LLANEEKLQGANNNFDEVKEKVIGQTFLVKSELDSAISNFIGKIQPPNLQDEDIRQCVDVVFANSESNLRALKQALYDYKRLHRSQGGLLDEAGEEVFPWLFLEVLIYRVAINIKIFDQNDLKARSKYPSAVTLLNRQHASASDYENDHLERLKAAHERVDNFVQKNFRSINPSHSYANFLSPEFVLEYFFEGLIDSHKFEKCFRASRFFEPESPEWLPLFQYLYLDDASDFESLYEKLWGDIEENQYMHPGDFLHTVGIFLSLSVDGYGKNEREIKQYAEKYIEKIDWSIAVLNDVLDRWGRMKDWKGRRFMSYDTDTFKEVCQLVVAKHHKLEQLDLKAAVIDLPNLIKEHGESALMGYFYSGHNGSEEDYYSVPVLLNLDVEKFVEAALSLGAEEQLNVFGAFSKRYTTQENFTQALRSEIALVSSIQSYLDEKSNSNDICQLMRLRLRYIQEQYIKRSIELLLQVQDEVKE